MHVLSQWVPGAIYSAKSAALVNAVALSATHMISGSRDKTCKSWDLATGQCLRTFEGHTEWVSRVADLAN